jgi:hypothetical protein
MPRAKFKLTEKRKRALAKAQRIAYGKRVTEKFKKTLERKRAINIARAKFNTKEVF